eukprot:snap_masked-scaffold_57-processed-gene-0.38-mRNA-1 protein AED:1.00 eAED:1.00 QI:0/-1/0/0/-1/1/1/0/59
MKNIMRKISSGKQETFSEGILKFTKNTRGGWKVKMGELSGEVWIPLLSIFLSSGISAKD